MAEGLLHLPTLNKIVHWECKPYIIKNSNWKVLKLWAQDQELFPQINATSFLEI